MKCTLFADSSCLLIKNTTPNFIAYIMSAVIIGSWLQIKHNCYSAAVFMLKSIYNSNFKTGFGVSRC